MSCIALYGILKSNYITLNILTIFVFFQNIVLVLISRSINGEMYNAIVLIKEIYVVLVVLWSFRKKRSVDRIEWICYISVLILIVLFFIHSKGDMLSRLASVRQLYLPFIFYIFGNSIKMSKIDMQKSIRFFINLSVLCVLFGFVEMALGDRFWALIGIKEYATFKGFDKYIYSGELVPGSFYSYDFYPIIPRFRRMASVFADPVILGQLLGFALVIAVFYKDLTAVKSKRLIYIVVIGTGLILTLAKGGVIIAAISILILMRKLWNKKIFSTLCIIVAIVLAIQYVGFGLRNALSISAHIDGFWEGVDILKSNLLGIGIGGYGNLGSNYSSGDIEGSESFIGAALGQIGIFAIIYVVFYCAFVKRIKKSTGYDSFSEILLWLNIGLLITAFVNNTAISFTNCYIFYVLPAINLRVLKENPYIANQAHYIL